MARDTFWNTIQKMSDTYGVRGPTDPSLKKLRNRLLLINIVSLTIVVVLSMSVVYLAIFRSVQNDIDERLRAIPPGVSENVRLWHGIRDATITPIPSSTAFPIGGGLVVEGIIVDNGIRVPVDYDKSFVANVMPDGQITVFSLIELDDNEFMHAVQTAIAMDNDWSKVRAIGAAPLFIKGESWNFKVVKSMTVPVEIAEYQTSIVFLNTEEELKGLRAMGLSLFVICAISILVILLLSYFFANRAITPVQASMDRQRRFVADASHELKTPITVISMNAEAAKGSTSGEEIANNLMNIETETTRMDGLVRDLISLAREEEIKPVISAFDIAEALEEETGRVETVLFEKGINFTFQKPDTPVIVHTDRVKLRTIISIFLDNAVKYTESGGRVKAIVIPGAGKTHPQIVIENTGVFIPYEDLLHVFDRFYRADKSRNSDTGGHGMGLAIAKEIAGGLGKQLKAESSPHVDGGAINRFTIIL